MSQSIRPCTPDEFDAVLALWRDAAAATVTDDIEGLRALLEHDRDGLLVAIRGDAIVGTVIAAWDGWRGGIYRLVVAPSQRRRGLAGELVRAAVTSLEQRGVRRIAAVVDADDEQAMAFWTAASRLGFERSEDRERFTYTR
ncbi:MAG TPA: GNAT family N-acetyltransferase [Dehalococcoidia bacterium]